MLVTLGNEIFLVSGTDGVFLKFFLNLALNLKTN